VTLTKLQMNITKNAVSKPTREFSNFCQCWVFPYDELILCKPVARD